MGGPKNRSIPRGTAPKQVAKFETKKRAARIAAQPGDLLPNRWQTFHKPSSQDRSRARGWAPTQMTKIAKTSSQDRSIARRWVPKQVAKLQKNEQPGSQHSEGMGSKTGGKTCKNHRAARIAA